MTKRERIEHLEDKVPDLYREIHGVKVAFCELLDNQPLQKIESLEHSLHSLIQTVEGHAGTLTTISYDIMENRNHLSVAKGDVKRLFDLCHDIQNKLGDYESPVLTEEVETLKSQHKVMAYNMDNLRGSLYPDIETNASHICDLNRQVADLQRELKYVKENMAILMVKLSGLDPAKVMKTTTDNPKPLQESASPTQISIYRLHIPNTADPSANLYWRRASSGQLHLCELGSDARAHPCCEAVDFPDTGRATKEQPKAYCGPCLQRFYNILCEGK